MILVSCSLKPQGPFPYSLSITLVLLACGLVFSLITFVKGGQSSVLAAVAKSGFTAAFSLIFVSEIGDKVVYVYSYYIDFFLCSEIWRIYIVLGWADIFYCCVVGYAIRENIGTLASNISLTHSLMVHLLHLTFLWISWREGPFRFNGSFIVDDYLIGCYREGFSICACSVPDK